MKEYKLMSVQVTKDHQTEESLMNKMSSEGWEVLSVSPDPLARLTVYILITFSRDK